MRSSTILLVLASVVAGEQSAVPPASTTVVVDCSEYKSKLAAAESKLAVQATELKTAAASLEARSKLVAEVEGDRTKLVAERDGLVKARAELTQTNDQLKEERNRLLKEKAALDSESQTLKDRLATEVKSLKVQAEEARGSLHQTRELYENAKKELTSLQSRTSQLGELETSLTSCERDKKQSKESHVREVGEFKSKHDTLERQLSTASDRLERLESRVFSEDHVRLLLRNTGRVARAFANNIRANVNRVFDADVIEILRLHTAILSEKTRPYMKRSSELYRTKVLQPYLVPYVVQPYQKQYQERTAALISEYSGKAYNVIDSRMNRMIDSLSKSDPQIRQLFPDTFIGKLIAFAYIFAVFYAALSIFSYLTSVIWTATRKVVGGVLCQNGCKANADKKKKTTTAPANTTKQPIIGNQPAAPKNIRFRK